MIDGIIAILEVFFATIVVYVMLFEVAGPIITNSPLLPTFRKK